MEPGLDVLRGPAFAAYGGAAVLAGAVMHRAVEAPFLRLRLRLRRPGAHD